MWLPSSLYESLPTAYIVIGVLFISGALYIGMNHTWTPIYFGLGAASILSGLFVRQRRSLSRRRNRHHDNSQG